METLKSSDCLSVKHLLNKVEDLDAKFKEHHHTVIDLKNEDQQLDEQQAVMDDYEDKVTEITDCLQQLRPDSKAASSAVHSTGHTYHLRKWLNDV